MQHAKHTCERRFFWNTYAHRLVVDCPTYHLPITSYHVQTRKRLVTGIFRNVILLGQKRGESNSQGACEPFTLENQFCFFPPGFPKSAWIQITHSQPMMAAIVFKMEERAGTHGHVKLSIGTRMRQPPTPTWQVYYNWYGTVRVPNVRRYAGEMMAWWPIWRQDPNEVQPQQVQGGT